MKSLILIATVFTLNAQATQYNYKCHCFESRSQNAISCEGFENLNISLTSTGKYASFEIGTSDWEFTAFMKGKIRPSSSKRYSNYYTTIEGGEDLDPAPDFAVEKSMNTGGKKIDNCKKGGFAKAVYTDENDYNFIREYVCCLK